MPRSTATQRQVVRNFGTCLNFTAASNKVTVTSAASISMNGRSSFGVSAWIYARSAGGTGFGRVVDKRGTGTSGFLILANSVTANSVALRGIVDCATTSADATLSVKIPLRQWVHVIMNFNENADSRITFYVNNTLQTLTSVTQGNGAVKNDSALDLTIGGKTATTDSGFDGYIDEVMFHTTALTSDERTALYFQGTVPSPTSARWKFDEGSGTSAADSIGSNTGTISGATYSSNVVMVPRTTAGTRTVVPVPRTQVS